MIDRTRRRFFLAAAGASAAIVACKKSEEKEGEGDGGVTPGEDLMREHGVLNRILLVYEEASRRIDADAPLPMDALGNAATIVQTFVEQYHEKLEEDFLFPRFEKANQLVDLVATLRKQHAAGRTLTDAILRVTGNAQASNDDRRALAASMRSFVRMYRPHEAREDTVLFPALHQVVPKKELEDLGERFEDEEHARFGKEGFEGVVVKVAGIERAFALDDLDAFTPKT